MYKEFKNTIEAKNISCTLPWIQGMLGKQDVVDLAGTTCTNQSYWDMNDLGAIFAKKAAKYDHAICLGKIIDSLSDVL